MFYKSEYQTQHIMYFENTLTEIIEKLQIIISMTLLNRMQNSKEKIVRKFHLAKIFISEFKHISAL